MGGDALTTGLGETGGLKRSAPIGGCAKGIPINWRTLLTCGLISPWTIPNDGVLICNSGQESSPLTI